MAKKNKIRYKAEEKTRITIILTGEVFLQLRDDEAASMAQKGDLLVYPYNDALNSTREGDYESTGFTGYFKADVSDGKEWKPVLLGDIFLHQEQYFSKKERPIDTYAVCEEILRGLAGKVLIRTYREHYQPEESEETSEE